MNEDLRNCAPTIKLPEKILLPKIVDVKMKNGMPLSIINAGDADVLRFSIVLNAGSRYQSQLLVAAATANMLTEGTQKYDSTQIADAFDFYGSSIDVSVDRDWICISIYSMLKYFEKTLEIVEQIIKHPTFPEKELNIYKQNNKQQMIVDNQKVSITARKIFISSIFGKTHYYGTYAEPNDYDNLNSNLLSNFHDKFYSSCNAFVLASGKIGDEQIKIIEKFFGDDVWGNSNKIEDCELKINTSKEKIIQQNIKNCAQTAIRVGKIMFSKNNEDYSGMSVLNTVLGGYFGSRLMTNIREEKGYTYGIYSALVCLKDSGYFTIAADVGNNYVRQTLDEIKKEIFRLQNEKISEKELSLVRNYMIGGMLRTVDGAWNLADVCIDIKQFGFNYNYIDRIFNEVKNITPTQLQQLAQKYFDVDSMIQVVAGCY